MSIVTSRRPSKRGVAQITPYQTTSSLPRMESPVRDSQVRRTPDLSPRSKSPVRLPSVGRTGIASLPRMGSPVRQEIPTNPLPNNLQIQRNAIARPVMQPPAPQYTLQHPPATVEMERITELSNRSDHGSVTIVDEVSDENMFTDNGIYHEQLSEYSHVSTPTPETYPENTEITMIDSYLRSQRYQPMNNLTVHDEGESSYIQALDPLGNKVYVKLDDGEYTASSSNDLRLSKTTSLSHIPYSSKQAAVDISNPEVSGVALVCKDGVCILESGGNESNYKFETSATITTGPTETIIEDDKLSLIPVIKLSEIRANALAVLQNTENVSCRILNSLYISCMDDMELFSLAYADLTDAGEKYFQQHEELMAMLSVTTSQYREYAQGYLDNPPATSAEQLKYETLLYNLYRRSEMMDDIVKSSRVMAGLASNVRDITRTVNDLNKYVNNSFQGVEGVLVP